MRLAFAVAAHLDPDILLLDEVLAVGDLSFQQKCLERVEGLVSEGRTWCSSRTAWTPSPGSAAVASGSTAARFARMARPTGRRGVPRGASGHAINSTLGASGVERLRDRRWTLPVANSTAPAELRIPG